MTDNTPSELWADSHAPICNIPVKDPFSALTEDEQLYAHFTSRAAFHGTRILLSQTSEESEGIYDLVMELYKQSNGDWNALAARAGVGAEDLGKFLDYAAMFLSNVGNYRSDGDTKFIPRIEQSALEKLSSISDTTNTLFNNVASKMYAHEPCRYGYSGDKQCASGFYPSELPITKDEVQAVQAFLDANGILPDNTRVRKVYRSPNDNKTAEYILHIASQQDGWQPTLATPLQLDLPGSPPISIQTSDYSNCLGNIITELQNARVHTANDTQKLMIDSLINAFRTGNHEDFKLAQTHWVKDQSPSVELVIGFIETYQDPHGVRGSWEGIVAIVNREQSRKFRQLTERSLEFIGLLPWNGTNVGLAEGALSQFESQTFIMPDFTSLDTVAFLKSEAPAGLNLPNFEDICRNVGSKNLEFGNVNAANPTDEDIPFIRKEDLELFRKHRERGFEVTTACHELLGHGSGRLFEESAAGTFNFDIQNRPINPLTGKPIDKWYRPGESWYGVFGGDANGIEECRAEGVGLLFLTNRDILAIFGYTDTSAILAEDVMYVGWLEVLYGAITGLVSWNPETKKWGQSHRRGQFALLRCILECGPDTLEIIESNGDIHISLNPARIRSHAVPAIAKLLLGLQVYRSTADVGNGVALLDRYAAVDDTFARYREIVSAKEIQRIQYVQPNTFVENGKVVLREYPSTREGIIQSWAERSV
ncbi:dipeptidyl-peptidase III [Cercophora samala]|uniref:Dipeptidyl-peptidase III n=1 Tax=Cercophora samala TaxID=330535 RepID=A0AA40DB07_9PEZI|nr:dipeptidyl-peptidase III [Cercophora samala]